MWRGISTSTTFRARGRKRYKVPRLPNPIIGPGFGSRHYIRDQSRDNRLAHPIDLFVEIFAPSRFFLLQEHQHQRCLTISGRRRWIGQLVTLCYWHGHTQCSQNEGSVVNLGPEEINLVAVSFYDLYFLTSITHDNVEESKPEPIDELRTKFIPS